VVIEVSAASDQEVMMEASFKANIESSPKSVFLSFCINKSVFENEKAIKSQGVHLHKSGSAEFSHITVRIAGRIDTSSTFSELSRFFSGILVSPEEWHALKQLIS